MKELVMAIIRVDDVEIEFIIDDEDQEEEEPYTKIDPLTGNIIPLSDEDINDLI
jgi:hypothetical protein